MSCESCVEEIVEDIAKVEKIVEEGDVVLSRFQRFVVMILRLLDFLSSLCKADATQVKKQPTTEKAKED